MQNLFNSHLHKVHEKLLPLHFTPVIVTYNHVEVAFMTTASLAAVSWVLQPTMDSLTKNDDLKWLRDAKSGLLAHSAVNAVWAALPVAPTKFEKPFPLS